MKRVLVNSWSKRVTGITYKFFNYSAGDDLTKPAPTILHLTGHGLSYNIHNNKFEVTQCWI
jgi:hypothetical protein